MNSSLQVRGRVSATAFWPLVRAGKGATISCETITHSRCVRPVCRTWWVCSRRTAAHALRIYKSRSSS